MDTDCLFPFFSSDYRGLFVPLSVTFILSVSLLKMKKMKKGSKPHFNAVFSLQVSVAIFIVPFSM